MSLLKDYFGALGAPTAAAGSVEPSIDWLTTGAEAVALIGPALQPAKRDAATADHT